MRTLIVFFVMFCYLVGAQSALAAAMPVRVNNAVSGSMDTILVKRGFAANDPRFGNTISAVSGTIGTAVGSAAAVTVAGVTAPAWASVALAAGIGAIVTYAVTIGVDALANWLFHSDNVDESSASPSYPFSAIAVGGPYWSASLGTFSPYTIYGGDGQALALQANALMRQNMGLSPDTPTCNLAGSTWSCPKASAVYHASGSPVSCSGATYSSSGVCTGYSYSEPAVPSESNVSIQTAINDLPQSDLNKQLNPAIIAALINRAWQQSAAQPGYEGLPYPEADPVTAEDVQPWLDANPAEAPTVEDFVSPNPSTSDNPTPFAIPTSPITSTSPTAATPNANTVNPASSQPQVNLGVDPATPQPTLEDTPTAHDILAPILNLMPDLRSFQVPAHSGECPKPQFSIWGTQFQLDAQCTLIEDNRATIEAAFYLVWAILALFIVLSA